MSRLYFAIPGDLATRTGGYAYDRRAITELRALGHDVIHIALPAGFPFPDPGALVRSRELLSAIGNGETVIVDGLAFGAMPEIVEHEARRLHLIALVHHPLALETGLAPSQAETLKAGEMRALAHARAVIATSPHTARRLAGDFDVALSRIIVAPPGTDPAPRATGSSPPLILSLGTLTPRKGHDLLLRALAGLKHLDWRCRIIGSRDRDPQYAQRLAEILRETGLDERVVLAGEVENVQAEMAAADIFVLASHYEGYGMAFAEALAQGVPVIGTKAGAVPDLVPKDAGLLVTPGDTAALATALGHLIADPELRARMSGAALTAGRALPDWPGTAKRIADTIGSVAR